MYSVQYMSPYMTYLPHHGRRPLTYWNINTYEMYSSIRFCHHHYHHLHLHHYSHHRWRRPTCSCNLRQCLNIHKDLCTSIQPSCTCSCCWYTSPSCICISRGGWLPQVLGGSVFITGIHAFLSSSHFQPNPSGDGKTGLGTMSLFHTSS